MKLIVGLDQYWPESVKNSGLLEYGHNFLKSILFWYFSFNDSAYRR